jgi:hypothetical protein
MKPGIDADGVAETEADHCMKCPGCGKWFEMRDPVQMLAHVHDAEIENSEGKDRRRAKGQCSEQQNAAAGSRSATALNMDMIRNPKLM